jgi:hypothetical protein
MEKPADAYTTRLALAALPRRRFASSAGQASGSRSMRLPQTVPLLGGTKDHVPRAPTINGKNFGHAHPPPFASMKFESETR